MAEEQGGKAVILDEKRTTVIKPRRTQLGTVPTLLLLIPFLVALAAYSTHLHHGLPEPGAAKYDSAGLPLFSEKQAMDDIRTMASHPGGMPKYRIVGTRELVEAEQHLLQRVEEIREEAVRLTGGVNQIEIFHQVGSSSHLFDFMDKRVWKKYYNISNVIVRLSDGTEASKANAVLVNAHFDSTLPSPGAADDLVGVATMLEALRVMATTPGRKMTNSVVFLFNGAEESLQDASHLFITRHPLRKTIRAVINLEACGVGGQEIVFQATSEEMIKALAHTPRPYGTVLASEIFGTGIITSDTDFRIFVAYGNLTGLDMAIVKNSYLYHTRLDLAERIEPGALQHMGENTLALLNYLTSPATKLGNHPEGKATANLPHVDPSHTIFFSGFGGKLFVVYSRAQATAIYLVIAAMAAGIIKSQVDPAKKGVYMGAVAAHVASFLGAIVAANSAAFVSGIVMGKTMTWFKNEMFPIIIFGPPALLGAILGQRALSFFARTPRALPALEAEESALLEHAILVGGLVVNTVMTLVGHAAGVGSSYLVALGAGSTLVTLLWNAVLVGKSTRIHISSYFLSSLVGGFLGVEGLVGFLDLFVPLTGRMGADAPVDFIIASLVSAVGFLTVPVLLPLCHRFGPRFVSKFALVVTFATAASLGWFTRPASLPYDADHPKRIIAFHMENITSTPPTFDLHLASIDGAPFDHLIVDAISAMDMPSQQAPVPVNVNDHMPEFDIIFPVSQFLSSYKLELPPVPVAYASKWRETFTVTAEKSILNSIKRTRTMTIVMDHPGLIWPVIAFDADVVSWDLPEPAPTGRRRHHVKAVSGFGVTRFTLDLVIKLTEDEFQAAVRQNQRAKGQRGGEDARDAEIGTVTVDYSGLDEHGMYPASNVNRDPAIWRPAMNFFKDFDAHLPDYVDSMLLSAIGGRVSL